MLVLVINLAIAADKRSIFLNFRPNAYRVIFDARTRVKQSL